MGVPATTVRVTPVGVRLGDGYQSFVAFAADPNVSLWEIDVKPPGMDAGDAIDTTTMHNVRWRSKAARSLIDTTNASMEVGYDPVVIDQIIALIGVEGAITVKYPNDDTESFFGFLKSFEPNPLKEGEFPTASCEIVCTNIDPADGTEAAPNYVTAAGTS